MKKQLKKLKKEASPSRAFKSELRLQLHNEMDTYMMAPKLIARYATVGITSLVLVLGAGTGAYAYESPEVVEGHPLHFVKEGVEEAERRLAISRKKKSEHHAKMLERRLKEADTHSDKPEKMKRILMAASAELGIALDDLREGIQNDENKEELIDRLTEVNAKYGALLDRMTDAQEKHEEVQIIRAELKDEALTPMEKREEFRRRLHGLFDKDPAEYESLREEYYRRQRAAEGEHGHDGDEQTEFDGEARMRAQIEADGFEGAEIEREMRRRRHQMLQSKSDLDVFEQDELQRLEGPADEDEEGDDEEQEAPEQAFDGASTFFNE